MLAQINSPLMPLQKEQLATTAQTPESEQAQAQAQIPLFQTIGILLSLYALHWQHDSQSISQWLSRIMPFLNHQQARLFLTEDKAPYGFASWVEVPEATHHQLLNDATWGNVEPQLDQWLAISQQYNGSDEINESNKINEPTYLWFIDLITPFSHALEATKDLKSQLHQHQNAWAININHGQHTPRRVW